jgi:hypothetical protein
MDGRAARGMVFAMPVSIAGWLIIFAVANAVLHRLDAWF